MTQGLLVDLDGTLADSVVHLKAIFFTFLSAHQIEASDEAFASFMGFSLHEIIRDLRRQNALSNTHEELYDQYARLVLNAYATDVRPMPLAKETLAAAKQKGVKLALVTAASETMAELFLRANGISTLFDAHVCAYPGEPGKPDPALYLRALKALGLRADEAIAIEDSLNGVKSALGAGCEVFWLAPEGTPIFNEKVHQVSGWEEIGRWIESI